MTYRDYSVTVTDSNILIAGYEDLKVVDAVYSFIDLMTEETLIKSEGNTILKWSGDYQKLHQNYKFENLTIGGVSLSEYRIVYPADDNVDVYMIDCARKLQDDIGRRSGIYLPIVSDSEALQQYEILLGETNREESIRYYASESAPKTLECALTVRNGKLLISCGNLFSLSGAVAQFDNYLISTKDGNLDSLNMEHISLKNANISDVNGDYRIMSYNVMHHAEGYASIPSLLNLPFVMRAANVAAQINQTAPDILFLQERFDEWAGVGKGSVELASALGDEYAIVENTITYPVSGGNTETAINRNPIIYNSNTFRVIESGYTILSENMSTQVSTVKNSVTWAVLEDITDSDNKGEKIIVFCTHWTTSKTLQGVDNEWMQRKQSQETQAVIRSVLQEYGDIPVVFGGDLNMMYSSGVYQDHLAALGLSDADVTINGVGSVQKVVDHISALGVEFKAYKMIGDATGCSDHMPIWCDIEIKQKV